MEPKLPAPNRGPENFPSLSSPSPEYRPSLSTPERSLERVPERLEQKSESSVPAETVQPILPPPVVISQPAPIANDTTAAPTNDAPLVANDDDLIEREWVDKAKKIIVETKDDPFKREQEVGRLQADYLKKRYGKELGVSN